MNLLRIIQNFIIYFRPLIHFALLWNLLEKSYAENKANTIF